MFFYGVDVRRAACRVDDGSADDITSRSCRRDERRVKRGRVPGRTASCDELTRASYTRIVKVFDASSCTKTSCRLYERSGPTVDVEIKFTIGLARWFPPVRKSKPSTSYEKKKKKKYKTITNIHTVRQY